MNLRSVMTGLLLAAICFSAACGGKKPEAVAGTPFSNAPEWVNRGGGAFEGDTGKAFYGVGSASGIRNMALLRDTADNRSRRDIAQVFQTYIAAMMKDYQRSTTAGDFSATSEEQDVLEVQKTITEANLSGVQIVDRWYDPNTGTQFSLSRLDLESFANKLEQMQNLNARVRDYVRQNAAKAFEDLETELQKKHQAEGQ